MLRKKEKERKGGKNKVQEKKDRSLQFSKTERDYFKDQDRERNMHEVRLCGRNQRAFKKKEKKNKP